jgi:hypothetical protein
MRIGEKLYHIRFGMWRSLVGTGNGPIGRKGLGNRLCSRRCLRMPGVRYNGLRLRKIWRIPLQQLLICNPGRLPRLARADKAV